MPDRRSEYDPDELPVIEPDEDPEYEPEDEPAAPAAMVRSVGHGDGYGERDYEYRSEALTVAQVGDGKTLTDKLTAAAADGWHLVQVIDAGDKRVLLLRRQKKSERERRSVGFAPPGR